ncbi:MAG: YHS domain-containing protein [Nitrospiraceae bacterium]
MGTKAADAQNHDRRGLDGRKDKGRARFMYRLLLVAGLLVVLYFLLRRAIRELTGKNGQNPAVTGKGEMVQDPACRTYVPRETAVSASIGGQTYFFCSQDCAQTFRKQLAG